MEIAAGLETPPNIRRTASLQVDRLNQGMKHRRVMKRRRCNRRTLVPNWLRPRTTRRLSANGSSARLPDRDNKRDRDFDRVGDG
jgi:hypothetical protein